MIVCILQLRYSGSGGSISTKKLFVASGTKVVGWHVLARRADFSRRGAEGAETLGAVQIEFAVQIRECIGQWLGPAGCGVGLQIV